MGAGRRVSGGGRFEAPCLKMPRIVSTLPSLISDLLLKVPNAQQVLCFY